MSELDVEQRLTLLEQEVRALRKLLAPAKDWRDTFGAFANDPGFDEVLRLGREIREREREAASE